MRVLTLLAFALVAAVGCATANPAVLADGAPPRRTDRPDVIAYQAPVGFADQMAGVAATSAYSAYNANIRAQDGRLTSQRLTTAPQIGTISISDGTGVTLTTPSAAVVKDTSGHLTVAGVVRGSVVVDGDNGTITIKKPGVYEICFFAGDGTGANTGTQTLNVFENINAGGAAALSPAIKAVAITLTAQPWIPLSECGLREYTAAQAAGTSNVVLDVRATSSTGNMVLKNFRFRVQKVDENDPAVVGP